MTATERQEVERAGLAAMRREVRDLIKSIPADDPSVSADWMRARVQEIDDGLAALAGLPPHDARHEIEDEAMKVKEFHAAFGHSVRMLRREINEVDAQFAKVLALVGAYAHRQPGEGFERVEDVMEEIRAIQKEHHGAMEALMKSEMHVSATNVSMTMWPDLIQRVFGEDA